MTRIPGEWAYFDDTMNMRFPWYTSPCLKWLSRLDLSGKRVWEYGGGESTKWYRAKGANVMGVESNPEWAEKSGLELIIGDRDHYTTSITHHDPFDIVIIDGIYRDECTAYALESIKPGGYLIIDNYKQPSVQSDWPLTDELIKSLNVEYFKEPDHYDWQTIVVRL